MAELTKNLFLLAVTHQKAPLSLREKMAISADGWERIYSHLKALNTVEECLVLSTCNRLEIYGVAAEDGDIQTPLENFLGSFFAIPVAAFRRGLQFFRGPAVVRHLFAVGAGLESQVIGETEILGQVKAAYTQAREYDAVGKALNPLFQKSFQAAKWARTHTEIGNGKVSIGSVAVDLAQRIFGDLRDSRTLVLGAGEIGARTLEVLRSRGAGALTVASRRYDRAKALARKLGAAAIDFEDFPALLPYCDILICGVSSEAPLIYKADLEGVLDKRLEQPLFLIDLAVPRNIDPSVAQIENVYLYNLDDLTGIAERNLKARQVAAENCRYGLEPRAVNVWNEVNHMLFRE